MAARIVSAGDERVQASRSTATSSRRAEQTIDVTGEAKIVIRPERVGLEEHGSESGPNRIPGMVERVVYVGSAVQVIVRAATGESLQALVQNTGDGIPVRAGHAGAAPPPARRAARPSLWNRRRAFAQGRESQDEAEEAEEETAAAT